MLGEFFTATPDEIDERLIGEGPYSRFPTVEAKTVSSVSISTLGECLGAGAYAELFERIESRQAAHGEAGIDQVPREIRDALADAEDLDAVAERWAATDELKMDGWEPVETRQVVGDLARLAREARDAEQPVWFWWSL
jgi:hypothetical protein